VLPILPIAVFRMFPNLVVGSHFTLFFRILAAFLAENSQNLSFLGGTQDGAGCRVS
jgi:hypothetical protein